jgi:hypothetical protein
MQPGTGHIHRPCQRGKTISDRIKQAQEHSTNSRQAEITLPKLPWEKEQDQ